MMSPENIQIQAAFDPTQDKRNIIQIKYVNFIFKANNVTVMTTANDVPHSEIFE